MADEPPVVLVVGTGAVGGIGRYERLLIAALDDLQRRGLLRYEAIWRREHPKYLSAEPEEGPDPGVKSEPASLRRFSLLFVQALRRSRPDVVLYLHVNLAQLAPLARLVRRRPYIVSTYGAEVWRRLPSLRRRLLARASQIWTISRFTADEMARTQEVPVGRITVIPLAIESTWLSTGADLDRTPQQTSTTLRLLSVSRLVPEARDKGIDGVIRALPEVLQETDGVDYRVVGDGADRPYLEDVARRCGVASSVSFLGPVSHEQLLEEYRGCDIFVLPSEREGFGLVFLEAMAFAKPVIARRAAAAAEVVEDRETGILVDEESEVADAILELARQPSRRSALGAAGRQRAQDAFSFATFMDRTYGALAGTFARDEAHERRSGASPSD